MDNQNIVFDIISKGNYLEPNDINNLCKINKNRFNFCNNDFWNSKIISTFPYQVKGKKLPTNNSYNLFIYLINIYNKPKLIDLPIIIDSYQNQKYKQINLPTTTSIKFRKFRYLITIFNQNITSNDPIKIFIPDSKLYSYDTFNFDIIIDYLNNNPLVKDHLILNNIKRGDILNIGTSENDDGKFIYDGKKIVKLDHYKSISNILQFSIPSQFQVINEFPINYWNDLNLKSPIVNFNTDKFTDLLIKNLYTYIDSNNRIIKYNDILLFRIVFNHWIFKYTIFITVNVNDFPSISNNPDYYINNFRDMITPLLQSNNMIFTYHPNDYIDNIVFNNVKTYNENTLFSTYDDSFNNYSKQLLTPYILDNSQENINSDLLEKLIIDKNICLEAKELWKLTMSELSSKYNIQNYNNKYDLIKQILQIEFGFNLDEPSNNIDCIKFKLMKFTIYELKKISKHYDIYLSSKFNKDQIIDTIANELSSNKIPY